MVITTAVVASTMAVLSAEIPSAAQVVVEDATMATTSTQGHINTHIDNVDDLFKSPYDWDRLRVDDKGRYVYLGDASIVSRTGIDVSEHQQSIDWQRVANDGIEFAIIRVGYRGAGTGAIAKDTCFDYNIQQARVMGLDVGVYFYSLATNVDEAREEATFAVNALEGATLEYPIVFDMEPSTESSERLQGLTKDEMTAIAGAFCEQVEELGYDACVYGNQTDLSRYHLMQLAQHGYWYAQYDTQPTMVLRFALWQYTQHGSIDGIEGNVDLDIDLTAVYHND